MSHIITLETKLNTIKGILPKFLAKLEKLSLETVRDLLWHFPNRYEDFSRVSKIIDLKEGELVTIRGEVKKVSAHRSFKRHMTIIEALITDETGGITVVWFNQPFIAKILKEGSRANFAGKVFHSPKGGLSIANPSYEILKGTTETTHTAGLVAVYPETRGLTSKGVRFLIKTFLDIIQPPDDFIPDEILREYNLPPLSTALHRIHFPKTREQAERAEKRFAFEYLFLLQLNSIKLREQLSKEKATALTFSPEEIEEILKRLPFVLTESQKRSLDELLADIGRPTPMNRLLQGDVGSGKTVVVAVAALLVAQKGYQAVFMAPTEVLARQHFHTLTTIFSHAKEGIGLITSSEARVFYPHTKREGLPEEQQDSLSSRSSVGVYEKGLEEKKTKAKFLKEISEGKIKIIIGTHALIASNKKQMAKKKKKEDEAPTSVAFNNLAFVVIDEQHRFGVSQRAALISRKGKPDHLPLPHFLSMSATPIPRTLSLAAFGDLDVSTINELPKGRKPIITKVIDPVNRLKAFGFIRDQIKAGRQAFFIYPRIETPQIDAEEKNAEETPINTLNLRGSASFNLRKSAWSEVKAVKVEHEKLSKQIFPSLRVEMLHGKMPAKGGSASGGKPGKIEIMQQFKQGKIDILASTSVIEVGVDVPNATIMVIEGADRFGLAQLYQFRGRVGRGQHQSFCFLFTDSSSESTQKRLEALLTAKNGFELAEMDLALRGPGEFLGERQTGLPDLAMHAMNNAELIKAAQDSAKKLLQEDPQLSRQPLLKEKLDSISRQVHLE